jgi:hypothetical protein
MSRKLGFGVLVLTAGIFFAACSDGGSSSPKSKISTITKVELRANPDNEHWDTDTQVKLKDVFPGGKYKEDTRYHISLTGTTDVAFNNFGLTLFKIVQLPRPAGQDWDEFDWDTWTGVAWGQYFHRTTAGTFTHEEVTRTLRNIPYSTAPTFVQFENNHTSKGSDWGQLAATITNITITVTELENDVEYVRQVDNGEWQARIPLNVFNKDSLQKDDIYLIEVSGKYDITPNGDTYYGFFLDDNNEGIERGFADDELPQIYQERDDVRNFVFNDDKTFSFKGIKHITETKIPPYSSDIIVGISIGKISSPIEVGKLMMKLSNLKGKFTKLN